MTASSSAQQSDDISSPQPDTAGRLLILGFAALLFAALVVFSVWLWTTSAGLPSQPASPAGAVQTAASPSAPARTDGLPPLLLAPAIGGPNACLDLVSPQPSQPFLPSCAGAQGSAAALVEQNLQRLGPSVSRDGHFEVGYTLVLPLLDFFRPDGHGGWAINPTAAQRVARTVAGVDRPVVLYFFSTHFWVDAPIEQALAADPHNLAETPDGPLPVDTYMGAPLYPWSIARTDNGITERREQAARAITDALCREPQAVQQRIAGINLLGEIHHLYPRFESGMGIGAPYVITDYSDASRAGFRAFLRQRFGDIAALNTELGTAFTSFDQIEPPAGHAPAAPPQPHPDADNAGQVAIDGWVRDLSRPAPDADPDAAPWVRIYVDGDPVGRVAAQLDRQDVGVARPELGARRVGWHDGLDVRQLAPGAHRIDIALERPKNGVTTLIHLGTRHIDIADSQQPGGAAPMRQPLPPMAAPDQTVQFWIDAPADNLALRRDPPGQTQTPNNAGAPPFWQRLDASSAGQFAISGWLRDLSRLAPDTDPAAAPWVRIYVDGDPAGRVPARYTRQDVSQARPDLGAQRVGWRADFDYRALTPGVHRVDVALERPQAGSTRLMLLDTRRVQVFERQHPDAPPPAIAPLRQPLPPMTAPDHAVQFWIDAPADNLALRYNPLAVLWNQFRNEQVVNYIKHFSHVLDGTCLAAVPRRTQQIVPATGAGWDETRFASTESLRPFDNVQLGVNLYGEATDDPAFFDQLAHLRQPGYSITEFHPLRALTAPQLRAVLEDHRRHGARTLSFFLQLPNTGANGKLVEDNPFAFDPTNKLHGSDALYRSMQQILTGQF